MDIHFTCRYCGSKFIVTVYLPNKAWMEEQRCRVCNDPNLKASEYTEKKINYYQGAPKFKDEEPEPEKDNEEDLSEYNFFTDNYDDSY